MRTRQPTIIGDVAYIPLTKGKTAIVDADLAAELCKYNWTHSVHGYPTRGRYLTMTVIMHHQIIGTPPLGMEVDHIDRDKLNNRRSNLRFVTHTENMRNTLRHKNRVGVNHDRSGNWRAYIDEPGCKRVHLGMYKTEEEARNAVALAREAKNA